MAKAPIDVNRLVAAARERRKGGHSALYELLWQHYDTLFPELSPPRVPNWTALANAMTEDGVTDGRSQPPTAATVRQTWWKVCRDKTKTPVMRKPRGVSAKPATPPQQVAPVRTATRSPVRRGRARADDDQGDL